MDARKPSEKPDNWPRHADGRRMNLGEMTPAQQREQWRIAAANVGRDLKAAGVITDFKVEYPQ